MLSPFFEGLRGPRVAMCRPLSPEETVVRWTVTRCGDDLQRRSNHVERRRLDQFGPLKVILDLQNLLRLNTTLRDFQDCIDMI